MTPHELMNRVDFEQRHLRPRYGHCREIAVAIKEFFTENSEFIVLTTVPGLRRYDHVLVEIEGILYEGSGPVTKEEIYERYVDPTVGEDIEEHFFRPNKVRENSPFDENAYRRAKDEIKYCYESTR